MAAAGKYDPVKSEKTHVEAIGKFVSDDVDEDLTSVPGIGPAAVANLEKDAFGAWLTELEIHRTRNTVTRAIAEKCNRFMKGLCDHSSILSEYEDRD